MLNDMDISVQVPGSLNQGLIGVGVKNTIVSEPEAPPTDPIIGGYRRGQSEPKNGTGAVGLSRRNIDRGTRFTSMLIMSGCN
jgi:hypothetical protein